MAPVRRGVVVLFDATERTSIELWLGSKGGRRKAAAPNFQALIDQVKESAGTIPVRGPGEGRLGDPWSASCRFERMIE